MLGIFIAALIFNASAPSTHAQFGGLVDKAKNKAKEAKPKSQPEPPAAADKSKPAPPSDSVGNGGGNNSGSPSNTTSNEESERNGANAARLAKAPGMPKPANTDAALNKLLMAVADETRLIPRRVVVTDKDWIVMTDVARGNKMRRIFAVIGRIKDDSSGNCAKQMVQFDADWRAEKNAWGHPYVQNIGEIVPIACSAIGK